MRQFTAKGERSRRRKEKREMVAQSKKAKRLVEPKSPITPIIGEVPLIGKLQDPTTNKSNILGVHEVGQMRPVICYEGKDFSFLGSFHCWGFNEDRGRTEAVISVGIVERIDGTISAVRPQCIRFLDVANKGEGEPDSN